MISFNMCINYCRKSLFMRKTSYYVKFFTEVKFFQFFFFEEFFSDINKMRKIPICFNRINFRIKIKNFT